LRCDIRCQLPPTTGSDRQSHGVCFGKGLGTLGIPSVSELPDNYQNDRNFQPLLAAVTSGFWNFDSRPRGFNALELEALQNVRCPILSQPPQAGKNESFCVVIQGMIQEYRVQVKFCFDSSVLTKTLEMSVIGYEST
jgi:hypothetical protein